MSYISYLPQGLKNYYYQSKKPLININSRFKNKFNRVKSVNDLREKNFNDKFIYRKIPNFISYNGNNNFLKLNTKYNSTKKKYGQYLPGIPLSSNNNSLYLHWPLSYKPTALNQLISNKNYIETYSVNSRNINNISNKNIESNQNNILLNDFQNKNFENFRKDEIFITNISENNFSNLINLNSIFELWDNLFVNKNYRELFCVIYKELDAVYKEELYQREIKELLLIKKDIDTLKHIIELRQNTIKEIYELNIKLKTEIFNNDNKSNEIIINKISDKIQILREQTVNVCKAMKKLKLELSGVIHLDKYDINKIAEKYNFDENYLIKMKGELNFLKEGFTKYYFNIDDDQSPFFLKASEKILDNEKDPLLHLVPINKELKSDIIECSYYIYQELIAYQNEKINKNILRCISPLKRIVLKNFEEEPKIINGIEEKENIININNNINNIINQNNISNNNNLNLKKSSSFIDNNIKIKEENNIESSEKKEIKNKNNQNNDNKNEKMYEKKDIINKNRNNKKMKAGSMGSQKYKHNSYKNILQNYRIKDRNINKQITSINRKKNDMFIDKVLIKTDKTSKLFSEKIKKDEENKKEIDKNID